MLRTKKILVGLDGSEMDQTLIDFISYITQSSPVEHIFFINIVKKLEDIAIPDLDTSRVDNEVVQSHKEVLQEQLNKHLRPDISAEIHLIVRKGNRFNEILKFITDNSVDIAILGHKTKSPGSGVLNQRLALRAPCNLTIIPEGYAPGLERLLVPIDFSEYSKMALEYAIYISRSNDNKVEILTQNIYQVPQGYHYSGKSYEEFAEIMKDNAEREYYSWVSRIDVGDVPIIPVFSFDEHDNFGEIVKYVVKERNVNGVVIGAKGRSAASALFIGSTAEKLIRAIDYLPLTIVRPVGRTAGLIESLSEL